MNTRVKSGPMLNVYPDSIDENFRNIINLLNNPELKNVFQSLYILPSVFNTDLDRGFSVIDYNLNELLVKQEDIEAIIKMDIDFKFDFVLNHCSILSKQFQDIIKNGEKSVYKDFFINWNKFWDGFGLMTDEGYIEPEPKFLKKMFFRKQGLPILNVRTSEGEEFYYWNTFYQKIQYKYLDTKDLMDLLNIQYLKAKILAERINNTLYKGLNPKYAEWNGFEIYKDKVLDFLENNKRYLGQMDLNIKSPLVWNFYEDTLSRLARYGAKIVRLDAFAYASKEPGKKNFFNVPETWDLLDNLKKLADDYDLTLLPEIHSKYEEKIHEKISEKDFLIYDFFLPGLIIHSFETHSNKQLLIWINDIIRKNIKTVNMLGCHDGIPILDLRGLLSDSQIQNLIDIIVKRGGYVKNLHGNKNIYYQVNSTYYSALGEDDRKLILARAIQIFMPGKPQVWYLDIFAGRNNFEAVNLAGVNGHKEINRTNLCKKDIENGLKKRVVRDQLELLKFRNTCNAFGFESKLAIMESEEYIFKCCWEKQGCKAFLEANLITYDFEINAKSNEGLKLYNYTTYN